MAVIRVIDIETTGIDPAKSAIIEIASVDMVRGGGITNAKQTFVAPGLPIPPVSSSIHHIMDEDVIGAPSLAEAIESFRGADVYVAHNCEFERSFLEATGINYVPWVCTYKSALRVWPEFESHSNQALRYELGLVAPFGIPRDQISPHRADSDVIVTAAILEELMKRAAWSSMLTWSAEPALHTKFSFGKHFGERYDVHPDYCQWILSKGDDFDAGVRFSAQYWLAESQKQEAAA